MSLNQSNNANNTRRRYGNYIINHAIIAGTVCLRGVILNEPDIPTVILAICHTTIETADIFIAQEALIYQILRVNPSPFVARVLSENIITTNNQRTGHIIIMQAANGSNLQTLLSTRGTMPLGLACLMLVQITAAVAHCHTHRIVLRDITIGHVFFAEPNCQRAFLGDLSKSKIVPPNPEHPGKAWLTDKVGTPKYVAQEVLTQQEYDGFAADIYSLGILFFVTIIGRFPFSAYTPAGLYQQIVHGNVEWPAGIPPQILTLLQRMMDRNPNTRITANQILSLPWLAGLVAENGIIIAPNEDNEMEMDEGIEDDANFLAAHPFNEPMGEDPSVGN
jgi:serine/threonine protein kinase